MIKNSDHALNKVRVQTGDALADAGVFSRAVQDTPEAS
jgi:hypothetical protein